MDSISGTPLRTNSYTWLNGDLRAHTDPRNLAVTNTYDALHRLTRVDYPDSTYTQNIYTNGAGLSLLDVTGSRDQLGYWTYYGYDGLRRIIAATNANNVVTRYGYCDCGAVSYITNAFGVSGLAEVTQSIYDYQGNRIQVYFPDSNSVTNTFDAL